MLKYCESNGIIDSFSKNHTNPYSAICVQELNLAHRFDKIFWNTACLTVNAGADENSENNKNTEYGKIAKAIGEIQGRGQVVALPHINKVKFGFSPDLETHEIVFGLKGVCGIGDADAHTIIDNQPYESIEDFSKKTGLSDGTVITLIKAGAFDIIENEDRIKIMEKMIRKLSEPLKSLNVGHVDKLKDLGVLTNDQLSYEYRLIKFRSYIFSNKKLIIKQTGKGDGTAYFLLPNTRSEDFFLEHFANDLKEGQDQEALEEHWYYTNDTMQIAVKKSGFENVFKKKIADFTGNVLRNSENLKQINELRFKDKWQEKAKGTVSKWEMDSLSFYHGEHELQHVNQEEYSLTTYGDLPEVPKVAEYREWRGRKVPRFALYRICGTVLDKDKNKNTITLLTPTGVVRIKFYKGQFNFYDRQLSHRFEGATSSTVLEKSWFKRGNKLLVTGYRRGNQFVPKKYYDSAFRHTVQLVKEIYPDGMLETQLERIDLDELD